MSQPTAEAEMTVVRSGCVDALSDVLDSVRLRSFVASRNEFTAPWGFRVPRPDGHVSGPRTLLNSLSGGFYAVTKGTCWLEVDGLTPPLCLRAGDIVVIIREQGHQLRDDLASAVLSVTELHPEKRIRKGMAVTHGGGGAMTTFIAGGFCFEDRECNRLFSALPPFIHIPAADSGTGPWLEETLRFIAGETAKFQPGTQSLLNQISHILFVQAVRAHLAKLPASSGNWHTALLDMDIALAMSRIHSHPHEPWTVASLADTVAMSRSAFAAKFTALIGEPPLRYLSHLRLARATTLLGRGRATVKQVAAAVGYESEASFSKAFKRLYGVAPGIYRKEMNEQHLPGQ